MCGGGSTNLQSKTVVANMVDGAARYEWWDSGGSVGRRHLNCKFKGPGGYFSSRGGYCYYKGTIQLPVYTLLNRSLRVGCPDRLLSENQFEAEISLNKSVNNSVGVFNLYQGGHATHGN